MPEITAILGAILGALKSPVALGIAVGIPAGVVTVVGLAYLARYLITHPGDRVD